MSLSTQSISYRLAIVGLLSYFPSLALPKLASKRMLDPLATCRALASSTVFTSHYRKNSRFQTSAPVLLKHSLSFTLQLFRPIIHDTQTLTFGVMAASGSRRCRPTPKLGLHSAAFSRTLERLSSQSQLPLRVPSAPRRPSDTCYSHSSVGTSSLKPHVLVAIAIVHFSTLRTLSNASPRSTLPYSTSCPLAVSQLAVSLVGFRNRLDVSTHMPGSLYLHSRIPFPCCSKPSLAPPMSRST